MGGLHPDLVRLLRLGLHQFEVIRAIILEESPCLLHGLCATGRWAWACIPLLLNSKDNKDNKESRDDRESRDNKDDRESRESRDNKDDRDDRENLSTRPACRCSSPPSQKSRRIRRILPAWRNPAAAAGPPPRPPTRSR